MNKEKLGCKIVMQNGRITYYPYGYSTYQLPAPLAAPSSSPTPPQPPAPAPTWDQAALLQAMNNFAAQGNSGMDSISDSGASSHMSLMIGDGSFGCAPSEGVDVVSSSFPSLMNRGLSNQ